MVNNIIGGFFMEKFKFMFEKYKIYIIGVGVFLMGLLMELGGFWFYNKYILKKMKVFKNDYVNIEKEEVIDSSDKAIVKEKKDIFVDIKGEVVNPGVYSIKENSRIIDVVNLAGGLTDKADTSANNMSKLLKDEMVIIIYSKDEILNYKKVKEEESKVFDECNNNEKNITNDSCYNVDNGIKNNDNNNKLININEASVDELMLVTGIGKSKAEKIVEYRNKNGRFEKLEDIMNVSGIGEALFEKIKEYICI